MLAHVARNSSKGTNYELTTYQDSIYYYAMSKNYLKNPQTLTDEFSNIPELSKAKAETIKYVDQNKEQFNAMNGLSHSPPYAYRILLPTLVGMLSLIGLRNQFGFLCLSSLSFAICGVFTFLLLQKSKISNYMIVLYCFGFAVSVVNVVPNGMYTDYLNLGLLLLVLYFERLNSLRIAFLISALSILNRETGIFLWLYVFLRHFNLNRSQHMQRFFTLFAFLGPLCLLSTRLFIQIPNQHYPFFKLASDRVNVQVAQTLVSLVFLVLSSSPLIFLLKTSSLHATNRADINSLFIGLLGFVFACLFGWNWIRFLIIFWPCFIFYRSLINLPNRNSHLAISTLGIGFLGIDDFLTFHTKFQIGVLLGTEILVMVGANIFLAYSHRKKAVA